MSRLPANKPWRLLSTRFFLAFGVTYGCTACACRPDDLSAQVTDSATLTAGAQQSSPIPGGTEAHSPGATPGAADAPKRSRDFAVGLAELRDAIDYARPVMADEIVSFDGTRRGPSRGRVLVAAWAENHMRWSDICRPTTAERIQRINEAMEIHAGHVYCGVGWVRSAPGKLMRDVLIVDDGMWVGADMIGPTAGARAGEEIRFCGVVTGRFGPRGSSGKGIQLVGMIEPAEKVGSCPSVQPRAPNPPRPI